jgi:hypothetical protein
VGLLLGAGGALIAIIPHHLAGLASADRVIVCEQAFLAYAAVGLVGVIYRWLPADRPVQRRKSYRAARPVA